MNFASDIIEGQQVCAGGHPQEAEAGTSILAQGGNAMDAAIAAAFVGFVVESVDCGLGGFARINYWSAPQKRFYATDGYVVAPSQAHSTMFEVDSLRSRTYYGHPPTRHDRAQYGPSAVAVPGAVAALGQAHHRCGRLPWKRILRPAIELAEGNVPFGDRDLIAIAQLQEQIRQYPETAALLLPNGLPPKIPCQFPNGDYLDTQALAESLKRIADKGAQAFYEGDIAKKIAKFVRGHGGLLSEEDLASYRATEIEERPQHYRNWSYTTCLDTITYEVLNILQNFPLHSWKHEPEEFYHIMAESLGISFTDTITFYGDPQFVSSPIEGLTSPAYAKKRAEEISLQHCLERPIQAGDPWAYDPKYSPEDPALRGGVGTRGGTSQMIAADKEGNVAAICTAVGWNYGSLMYVPELGIFLNNGMHYFDPCPNRPSSIAPGKRPLFGAPVLIATDGGLGCLAACGSGGYRITTAVLHTLIHSLDFQVTLDEAIDRPRVHAQGQETFIDSRIESKVINELAKRGHRIQTVREDPSTCYFGRLCALRKDPKSHQFQVSSGPPWRTGVAAL